MWIVWLSWDLLLPAAIPDFIRDHPGGGFHLVPLGSVMWLFVVRRADAWVRALRLGLGRWMWIVWLSWDLLLPAAIPDFIRDHPWVVRGMGFVVGWWVGCLINYRRLAPCRSGGLRGLWFEFPVVNRREGLCNRRVFFEVNSQIECSVISG